MLLPSGADWDSVFELDFVGEDILGLEALSITKEPLNDTILEVSLGAAVSNNITTGPKSLKEYIIFNVTFRVEDVAEIVNNTILHMNATGRLVIQARFQSTLI